MKWRARTVPKPIRKTWKGESVVFSPISGETHFLNAFSDEALAAFETQPLSIEDLIDKLRELTPPEQLDGLRDSVTTLVHRFDDVGLIEPCPS